MVPDEALYKSELDDKNILSEDLITPTQFHEMDASFEATTHMFCTHVNLPIGLRTQMTFLHMNLVNEIVFFSLRKKFEPINDIYRKLD